MPFEHPSNQTVTESDLGARIGLLRSTPESLQKTLIGISVVAGLACAIFLDTFFILLIFGFMFLAAAMDFVLRRVGPFCTRLAIHENGLQVTQKGTTRCFLYSDVEQFSVSEQDFHTHVKGVKVYVGTRVKIDLLREGELRRSTVDMECHRKRKSWKTIHQGIDRLSDAVQLRLSRKLESGESIPLSLSVSFTIDGIECHDRVTAFEDIGGFRRLDHEVQVYRSDEALPFASFSTDGDNFVPHFALLQKMCSAMSASAGPPTIAPNPFASMPTGTDMPMGNSGSMV